MQHEQVDGHCQNLERLLQQLAKHWATDWDSADYPGKIFPELLEDPSKGRGKEREIVEKILVIVPFAERRGLAERLREAYTLVRREPELQARLERLIRNFHLSEAEAFFQRYSGVLGRTTYEKMRKDRVARRRDTIQQDLSHYRFQEAGRLMEETCKDLLPDEKKELREWFQATANGYGRDYLQQEILPLLKECDSEEARRRFERIKGIVDIREYEVLEAEYAAASGGENPSLSGGVHKLVIPYNKNPQKPSRKVYFLPEGETPESWRAKKLRLEVGKRGIVHLVHFTPLRNVPSIVERGLLPRAKLDQAGIPYASNDEKRLDNFLDASSLSISFPNYKMFYRYRQQDESKHWAVLLLAPSILWEYRCFFCRKNAATSEMRDTDLAKKRDLAEFTRLFEVLDDEPRREATRIPDWYTTDPQAEVLVRDVIPPSKIQAVAVEDMESFEKLNRTLPPAIHCVIREDLFGRRMDCEDWPSRREYDY